MTVREICKAHNITTLDEQDELLVRLVQDREALLRACKDFIAEHDSFAAGQVYPNEPTACNCGICMRARKAIAQAEAHQ